MITLQSLRWLLLATEVCVACPIVYLCVLSIFAGISTREKKRAEVHHDVCMNGHTLKCDPATELPLLPSGSAGSKGSTHFAVLVPAHNEEALLGSLLESLAHLEYPKELYTVYVVADNCTDGTAKLARQFEGVCIFERFESEKRGKGYALHWIWQQLEERRLIYDAYLILDADSVIVPTFLQAMDKELVKGARALQACNTVLNVSASASTALRWVALTLMNHIRPLGRNALGGSSTLTGNGMCLSRDLLLRHPWQAFGIAEDYQYYLSIIQEGETVRYVPEAVVRSHMPTTFHSMRTQDVRWEASAPQQPGFRIALRLLGAGLRLRSFVRIEAAAELLTPPLSLLVTASFFLLAASFALGSLPAIVTGLALVGGLVYYIATPFALLRPPRTVYSALLHAPGFMLWKVWVYFVLSRSRKHTSEWVRTSRATHPSQRADTRSPTPRNSSPAPTVDEAVR